MKKILFVIPFALLLAAGCSSTTQTSTDQTPTPTDVQMENPTPTDIPTISPIPTATSSTTPTPTKSGAETSSALKVATDVTLGKFLTASNGMTLYYSNKDTANTSNCTGTCAANWPPYTPPAGISIGAIVGLTGKVSTITRDDGTTQVTYKGMPLYLWVNDSKPGDTTGQNVNGFFVVKP